MTANMAIPEDSGVMDVRSADPDRSCDTMLINVPTDMRTAASVAIFFPYSLDNICGNVFEPLVYNGFAKIIAIITRPIPPPRVNHQAEKP